MGDNRIYMTDVIMRCLLKWRIAIICIILGACVLSAFGIYRQNRAVEASLAPQEESALFTAAAAEAEAKLTDTQISEVYLALDRYMGYQNSYNSLYDYYFGSIIGQMDATGMMKQQGL